MEDCAVSSSKKSKLSQINDEVKDFHPVLEKILNKLPNVISVEYTHGQEEMGADFVVALRDKIFGNTEYVGVIAKVGKVVQDFSDIMRQIEECEIPRTFWGVKRKSE